MGMEQENAAKAEPGGWHRRVPAPGGSGSAGAQQHGGRGERDGDTASPGSGGSTAGSAAAPRPPAFWLWVVPLGTVS